MAQPPVRLDPFRRIVAVGWNNLNTNLVFFIRPPILSEFVQVAIFVNGEQKTDFGGSGYGQSLSGNAEAWRAEFGSDPELTFTAEWIDTGSGVTVPPEDIEYQASGGYNATDSEGGLISIDVGPQLGTPITLTFNVDTKEWSSS